MSLVDALPIDPGADSIYAAFGAWVSEQGLTLYPHQDEAAIELFSASNVVLGTPTGSGKSLVAVAAHAVAQLPNDIPVVAVEAGPAEGIPVVTVDQFAGAELATQHLLDLGHLRQRRPGQLLGGQGRSRRPHENDRQGVGPVQSQRQRRRVRLHRHAPDPGQGR